MLRFPLKLMKQLMQMIAAMMNSLLRIFGLPQIPVRQPLPSVKKSGILSEAREILGQTRQPPTSDKILKPTTEAGHTLWRYACAKTPEERAGVALSALTTEQQDWLLMLSDDDLNRLAKIGIDGCTRAIAEKRCGVGRLPEMPAKQHAVIETNEMSTPLARRIQAYRTSPAFA